MNDEPRQSEWNKPLTKGDFTLHHLDNLAGIYMSLSYLTGVLGLFGLGKAVYDFFVVEELSKSLTLFFCAVLAFLVARAFYREWKEVCDKRKKIREELWLE